MKNKKTRKSDILQTILKPFLSMGYVIMLGFGLVYYAVYALIIKITKAENYYGDMNGFMQSVKAIVFSSAINKHRDLYQKRKSVKKSRKQTAEYIERPRTRVYSGNRSQTRVDNTKTVEDKTQGNYFIKRLLAHASIFFLKEDIRKEKAKEIDQKYPKKIKPETLEASYSKAEKIADAPKPSYSKAESVAEQPKSYEMQKVVYTPVGELSNVNALPKKIAPMQRRIMIGSVSIIAVVALIFVGALAYAQELPEGLNFISPKPTADLFQATVPIPEEQVCEIAPDGEQSLYLAYPEDTVETQNAVEQAPEEVLATVETNANEAEAIQVSGNITTQPKIYKQDDEDPEIAKIQARLMELHYMKSDDVTNYYGKNTTYAMEYFQRQHGLQVDGTAGAETLAILYSDDAQEYKLDEGTEGTDVKEMQKRLYDLKYLSSSSYVTGYFGTKTKAAVKDFQSTNGLSADGVVGSYTHTKLFSSSAIKNTTSSSSSSSSSSSGGNTSGSGVTGSGSAADIVKVAMSLKDQGYIYVWGGKNPSSGGFDCSGFVYYVLRQAGISTGYRDTDAWATTSSYTTIEKMEDVKPGDVLVFSSGHVAIYIGDGKMIHSTSKNDSDPGGIYIDNFFTDYRRRVWIWGKRIAN